MPTNRTRRVIPVGGSAGHVPGRLYTALPNFQVGHFFFAAHRLRWAAAILARPSAEMWCFFSPAVL
jgi:hypothetical protein